MNQTRWVSLLVLLAAALGGCGQAGDGLGVGRLAGNPAPPDLAGPAGGKLSPGAVLLFDNAGGGVTPMAVGGSTSSAEEAFTRIDPEPSSTPAGPVRLRSRVTAVGVGRPETEIYEYVEFEVDDADSVDTVLPAQVSGSVDIRGWMALAGYGQVEAQVVVELEDVTFQDREPADGGLATGYPRYILRCEQLADYQLVGELGLGVEAKIDALIGSATGAQAGLEFTVGIDIPLELELIRDRANFKFPAMVQTGHRYQVRVTLTSQATARVGIGWAMFGAPAVGSSTLASATGISDTADAGVPVDLLDPDTWLDSINLPLLDRGLGDLGALTRVEPKFRIPSRVFQYPKVTNGLAIDGQDNILTQFELIRQSIPARAGAKINQSAEIALRLPSLVDEGLDLAEAVIDRFGLPRNFREAVRDLLARDASLQQTARLQEDADEIENPGVTWRRLEVLLEQDTVAVAKKALN